LQTPRRASGSIRGAKLNALAATLRESEVFGEWDVIVQ
jgi:hypothetical protein